MRSIHLIFCLGVLFFSCKNSGDPKIDPNKLNWLTIEQADKIPNADNKKFLVDVYTEWCGWCKVMDNKTFTDPEVIKYLNENFYVVKFDAEQKEPVTFKGKTFNWEPLGRNGINMLGMELLNSRMSYPTLVYLDAKLNPITVSPGYKTPEQLLGELKNL